MGCLSMGSIHLPCEWFSVEKGGGAGKSCVIQTVTDVFKARGARNILVNVLPSPGSDVVAFMIDGKTTDIIAGISLHSKVAIEDGMKKMLQEFWRGTDVQRYRRITIEDMIYLRSSPLYVSN